LTADEDAVVREQKGPALVVGLGNPGIEYQFTPHNAGFLAIDRLAEQGGVAVANRRCRALTATTRIAGRQVVLAKPETYMNLSGISVQALVKEFDADATSDQVGITESGQSPAPWVAKIGCGFESGLLPRGMRRQRERGGGGRIMCSHLCARRS